MRWASVWNDAGGLGIWMSGMAVDWDMVEGNLLWGRDERMKVLRPGRDPDRW